jgi:hypothetical protein
MNWIELKALHELYVNKDVPRNQTLSNSDEIGFLVNSLGVLEKTSKKLIAVEGFEKVYENLYKKRFSTYHNFLTQNNLLKPQSRFELTDCDILIKIQKGMESGDLKELREQIIAADESLKGISLMFFKNEKYLLQKPSLVDALKKILQVDHFSVEKDQQYMYKLECIQPKAIVLCENLDFLTKPNKPRKYNIELWYAGGKNIQKLGFSDTRNLPIYYSADWDYDGLLTYTWVKEKLPGIELLMPNAEPRSIKETEHESLWQNTETPALLSGLEKDTFTSQQINLVRQLMTSDQWIVEESNDLITMLKNANIVME